MPGMGQPRLSSLPQKPFSSHSPPTFLSMSAKRFSWFSMQASRCPESFSPFVQFVVRLSIRFSSAGRGRMPRRRKRDGWDDGDLRDGETGFFRDGAAPNGGGHARENIFQSLENGRKIFQSLENPARFFQPLEKNFPIVGKLPAPPPALTRPRPSATFPPERTEASLPQPRTKGKP